MELPTNFLRALHRPKTLLNKLEIAREQALESCQQEQSAALRDELEAENKAPSVRAPRLSKPKSRGGMNKTESAYAAVLKRQQDRSEILRFTFEGIRLKWGHDENTGEAMNYKPDFCVVLNDRRIRCIEVKGAHIFDRDLVRFKGCRAEWRELEFEMHQWKKGEWKRIH